MDHANLSDAGRLPWLEAARLMLLDEGAGAISIAGLARQLGVSRGAFYWHFETRETLLAALLPIIAKRAVPECFGQLEDMEFNAGMLALLDVAFFPDTTAIHARLHAHALQRWGDHDTVVHQTVRNLNLAQRIQIRRILVKAGLGFTDARIRSDWLSRVLCENDPAAVSYLPDQYATDLEHLFRHLSGQHLPAHILSRHLNTTLRRRLPDPSSVAEARCAPPPALQQLSQQFG